MADDYSDLFTFGEFDDSPFGIEDLQLLGDPSFLIGVTRKSPADLKKRVFAAAKSYTLRMSSMDYLYKRYSQYWELTDSENDPFSILFEMTSETKRHVRSALERVRIIPDKPDHPGLLTAGMSLYRLQFTFRSAILLLRNNFHFESTAIIRMILEHLAWTYCVYQLEDDSIFKTQPTACISELKTIFPSVGKLYGKLSRRTHMDPRTLPEFVCIENGQFLAFKQYPYLLIEDAYLLLLVADIYICLTEIVYRDLLNSFIHTIEKEESHRTPNPSRPIASIIRKYGNIRLHKI